MQHNIFKRNPRTFIAVAALIGMIFVLFIVMPGSPSQQLPPSREEMGRNGWTLLHSIVANFPEEPDHIVKQSARNFFMALPDIFPCKTCAAELKEMLKVSPPILDTRADAVLWLCEIHNQVNTRLGKPLFDCTMAESRWRNCGCKGTEEETAATTTDTESESSGR
eukprot:TRINITY_DN8883_c0_g1_i1.p1 TRINITY_DN8883_c0_g1~~TRINITY_DN8883_c0_g1_i1.p1  ORF type:complete len:165 (+),score=19.42 TRINITY_DN8883_c0_g1_i1:98-592(+)